MKTSVLLLSLVFALLCRSVVPVFAQAIDFSRNRFELRFNYTLQRLFTTASPSSLVYARQAVRLRHGLGIGLRYYPLNHWFAEYQLGLSPEGGGYQQQFINPDYLCCYTSGF